MSNCKDEGHNYFAIEGVKIGGSMVKVICRKCGESKWID